MEYVYPSRKNRRRKSIEDAPQLDAALDVAADSFPFSSGLMSPGSRQDSSGLAAPLRKLGASRSFTDLRSSAAQDSAQVLLKPSLYRTRSSEYLKRNQTLVDGFEREPKRQKTLNRKNGDAAAMKTCWSKYQGELRCFVMG